MLRERPLTADPVDSMSVPRMAGYGASRPLPRSSAKVACRIRKRRGGNSSIRRIILKKRNIFSTQRCSDGPSRLSMAPGWNVTGNAPAPPTSGGYGVSRIGSRAGGKVGNTRGLRALAVKAGWESGCSVTPGFGVKSASAARRALMICSPLS